MPVLHAVIAAGGPAGRVEVAVVEMRRAQDVVERQQRAGLGELGDPGHVERNDVVVRLRLAGVAPHLLAQCVQPQHGDVEPGRERALDLGDRGLHGVAGRIDEHRHAHRLPGRRAGARRGRRDDAAGEIRRAEIEVVVVAARGDADRAADQLLHPNRIGTELLEQSRRGMQRERSAGAGARLAHDQLALEQRVDPAHRRRVGRAGDGRERGHRDQLALKMAAHQEQRHAPFRRRRRQQLDRVGRRVALLHEVDDAEQFLPGHGWVRDHHSAEYPNRINFR